MPRFSGARLADGRNRHHRAILQQRFGVTTAHRASLAGGGCIKVTSFLSTSLAKALAALSAEVAGYLIEGHVPVRDIVRLLQTRPAGIAGLAVPGRSDPYDVLAFNSSGRATVVARYPA